MRQISYVFAVLTALLFASCSKTDNGKVEFIPFQETADGQWGMISLDGKVLFSEEFKNKPTVVRDGRFFVQTAEGGWEMFDATEKPQKVGADYAHVSGFRNGVALVAEKGKPVSIIDTDGKTKKVLDKIEGKEVDGVRTFEKGYAVFMTVDSLFGVIDQSGDCVIKPEYCVMNNCGDGKFLAVNSKYRNDLKKGKKAKVKFTVLTTSGSTAFEFNADKYEDLRQMFSDGLLPICVKKDGKETWGIINDKGEEVVKPSLKIKNIGNICGDKFTYYNGEGWGLMNTKGETLIRAKYEFLYYDGDNMLVAIVKKDSDTFESKYVNEKDEQIGDETYVSATPFTMFDGEHAIVKPNDKIYSIITRDASVIAGLPDIVNISTYEGEDYIESDFVDLKKLVEDCKITKDGMFGFSFNLKVADAIKAQVKAGNAPSNESHKAGDPYWYDYTDEIWMVQKPASTSSIFEMHYSGKLTKETFRTKRIIDYTIGDWYWYHDKKIPTGYVYNSVSLNYFQLQFSNDGRMHGKLRDVLNTFVGKFKSMGKIVKQNNGAAVISTNDGKTAFMYMEKKEVVIMYGNLGDASKLVIDKYKDVVEDGENTGISYGYLNSLFPDRKNNGGGNYDTEEVDTVAVDTVAAY